MAGEEVAKKYQQAIFLAGSASAEFFADIALCPFEAVKVCSLLALTNIGCYMLVSCVTCSCEFP